MIENKFIDENKTIDKLLNKLVKFNIDDKFSITNNK